MKSARSFISKVFLSAHYSIHYRRVRRVQWSSTAPSNHTILFLLNGKLVWEAAGATGGEINRYGALLVNPGETTSVRGAGIEFLTLTLASSFVLDCAVRTGLTRVDNLVAFRQPAITQDERLARSARDMTDELLAEEAGQGVILAALVEQVIVHLLRRYADIRHSSEIELSRAGLVDRRIRRAVELMHAHLNQDLPLEDLAAAAYLSPFHFARLFKKVTGTSPHAYLAALRMMRAERLLAETDLSITEVGARVGYNSSSHFAKAFRQTTGLAPRAFRAAVIRG
ncbi:MAG: helix-turn-helix domain-containing protein [Pyrinomonadaceae bacterium]|nr:helix-turn-helix domain-containing protein [Pyrinomonadaceae bacterium]